MTIWELRCGSVNEFASKRTIETLAADWSLSGIECGLPKPL